MTRRERRIERAALFEEQGGRCAYCDEPMTWLQGPRLCTIDHVIPCREGGTDGLKVAACYQCNRLKGCMTGPQIRKLADRIDYLLSRATRTHEAETIGVSGFLAAIAPEIACDTHMEKATAPTGSAAAPATVADAVTSGEIGHVPFSRNGERAQ